MASCLQSNAPLPECSICCESFKTPKFIPCGHTFCLDCIERYIRDKIKTFPCPICGQEVTIPKGGAKMFTTNFIVQTPTSAHTSQVTSTASQHSSEGSGKTIPETSKVTDQPLSTVRHNCPVHSNRIVDYYCLTCRLGLCAKCILKDHKDHEYLDVECETTKEIVGKELSQSEMFIKETIGKLEKTNATLKKASEKLQTLCNEACAKVQAKTAKLVQELEVSCENSKSKIKRCHTENVLQLETTQEEMTNQIKNIKTDLDTNLHPSETPFLSILESLTHIQKLVKHCEDVNIDIPKLTCVEWKENEVGVGYVVIKSYCMPAVHEFRFNLNKVKSFHTWYHSKNKFTNNNVVLSCFAVKYESEGLCINIRVLPEDNPKFRYSVIDYKVSLLNFSDDNKTITKTDRNKTLKNDDWSFLCCIPWVTLSDKSTGFLTSNGQFVVQFEITHIREISFKSVKYLDQT